MKKVLAVALAMAFVMVGSLSAKEGDKWFEKLSISGNVDASLGLSDNVPGPAVIANTSVPAQMVPLLGNGSGKSNNFLGSGFGVNEARLIAKSSSDDASVLLEVNGPFTVVTQAFISKPCGPVAVKLGQFNNPLRLEAVDISDRLNVSGSQTTRQQASGFTGVEVSMSPLEMLSIGVIVANPPATSLAKANDKEVAALIGLTPMKDVSVNLGWLMQPVCVTPGFVGSLNQWPLTPAQIAAMTTAFNAALGNSVVYENKHTMSANMTVGIMEELSVSAEYLYQTQIANSATVKLVGMGPGGADLLAPLSSKVMAGDDANPVVVESPKLQGYSIGANVKTPLWDIVAVPRFSAMYDPEDVLALFDYTLTLKKTEGAVTTYLEVRADACNYPVYSTGVGNDANDSTGVFKDGVYSDLGLAVGMNYAF